MHFVVDTMYVDLREVTVVEFFTLFYLLLKNFYKLNRFYYYGNWNIQFSFFKKINLSTINANLNNIF